MITVLASQSITKLFRFVPFFNIYCKEDWTIEDNINWLDNAIDRNDWILIKVSEGDVFKKEINHLCDRILNE